MFSLKQGYQTVIIIGRLQAAIDIMEKEGAALADRPRNIPGETVSGGMRLLFVPAGERLRRMRRLASDELRYTAYLRLLSARSTRISSLR